MAKKTKHTIGRIERVNLPTWNIEGIEAKIDTGAFTSSVHCHHIELFDKEGVEYVRFNLLDPEHEAYNEQLIELPVFDKREVKSSNGFSSIRVFIKTRVTFFGEPYDIEFSLTDRTEMRFPLLIGRKFIRNRFLVDVSLKNQSFTSNSKQIGA